MLLNGMKSLAPLVSSTAVLVPSMVGFVASTNQKTLTIQLTTSVGTTSDVEDVQAVVDANLRFIYFGVISPGRTNDARAFN